MGLFYRYFGRYFYENEVGDFFSIINCLIACFWMAVGAIYLLKPWGLLSWHRTVTKNRIRLRKQHMDELDNELGNVDQIVQLKRLEIVALNLDQLIEALQSGVYTAKMVVDAYRWKAMQVQKEINCVTEFIVEAPKLAEDLDEKYGNGDKKPALFGVPFSVKDNFWQVGYACSRGLAKESEWPMKEECSFVAHLRSLGAVPIVRTNVPQTLMNYVCSNPLFGTTLNPLKKDRTPGGSSGGECALVAANGIPFGIGSDLAGSLRIPANFCGLTTIKPTAGRMVVTGAHGGIPGICRLALGYGYFTHTVDELEMLMELTMDEQYFSRVPQNIPQKWTKAKMGKRLKIGYFADDGFMKPAPACERAVLETKEMLESLGHELIPFTVPDANHAASLTFKSCMPDCGKYILKQIEYEDMDPLLAPTFNALKLPVFLRKAVSWATQWKYPQISILVGSTVNSIDQMRITNCEVQDYISQFTQYWMSLELDCLICPAFMIPPPKHDAPCKLSVAGFSTALFNLLDYPAGVLPVTKVSDSDDEQLLTNYPVENADTMSNTSVMLNYPLQQFVRKGCAQSKGLPIGVQVVTLPFKDEQCLGLMRIIQQNVSL